MTSRATSKIFVVGGTSALITAPRRNRSAHLHRPWRAIFAIFVRHCGRLARERSKTEPRSQAARRRGARALAQPPAL
jgi:hypothetical protein